MASSLELEYPLEIRQLRELGHEYVARNWSRGTSSNYSIVTQRNPLRLLITASGKHKERLQPTDFVLVDGDGCPTSDHFPAASAETMLHVALARDDHVGSILHTHSVWSTILSDHFFPQSQLSIAGYEMLKGLAGQTTHDTEIAIRIFDNTQDIASLAREVTALRAEGLPALRYGLLLRGHGLYTWGVDFLEAKRHLEVLEFLFEVIGARLCLGSVGQSANE